MVFVQGVEAVLISRAKGILSGLTAVINLDLLHTVILLSGNVLHTLVLKLDCRRRFLLILHFLAVCASGWVYDTTMRWRIDYYLAVLSLFPMTEYRLLEPCLMLVSCT